MLNITPLVLINNLIRTKTFDEFLEKLALGEKQTYEEL